MRILRNTICAIALFGLMAACAGNGGEKFVAANDPDILFMGRTVTLDDGSKAFNYPGVTAMFNFEGEKVDMLTSPGAGYFMVEVDGQEPRKVFVSPTDSVISIADSLGDGRHSARVTYAIEGYEFHPVIKGLRLGDGTKLLAADKRPDLKLEFIGNSITCGYGTEADSAAVKFSYDTENHCLSYAHLTARALDADVNIVARSGIGIYRNFGDTITGGSPMTMPKQYFNAQLYDDTRKWDPKSFQPDIILINLGTNDTSENNYDIALFEQAYREFLDQLLAGYPDSKFVLLTGAMLGGKALDDVKATLDRLKGDNPRVFRFDMSPQTGELGYGADWHPSRAQAQRMADELTDYLRTNLIK